MLWRLLSAMIAAVGSGIALLVDILASGCAGADANANAGAGSSIGTGAAGGWVRGGTGLHGTSGGRALNYWPSSVALLFKLARLAKDSQNPTPESCKQTKQCKGATRRRAQSAHTTPRAGQERRGGAGGGGGVEVRIGRCDVG